MKTIVISRWYGRFGNNILQILNALIYALDNNYNKIILPDDNTYTVFNNNYSFCHKEKLTNDKLLFIKYEIIINDLITDEYLLEDIFFDYGLKNLIDYTNHDITTLFNTYIKPCLNTAIITDNNYNSQDNNLIIHIRSGDIFCSILEIEKEYVQPPLYYYKTIMNRENTQKCLLVTENLLNPVAEYLVANQICYWNSNDLIKDINHLVNAKILCLGYGTFGIIILLLNNKVERVYIPDYYYEYYLNYYKFDIKKLMKPFQSLIIIALPDYIKVNEFIYDNSIKKIMMDYRNE